MDRRSPDLMDASDIARRLVEAAINSKSRAEVEKAFSDEAFRIYREKWPLPTDGMVGLTMADAVGFWRSRRPQELKAIPTFPSRAMRGP